MAITTHSVNASVQYQQNVQLKEQRITAPPLNTKPEESSKKTELSKEGIGDTLLNDLPPASTPSTTQGEDLVSPADEESALIKLLLAKLIAFLNPEDKDNATVKMLEEEIKTLSSSQLTSLDQTISSPSVENSQENVLHIIEFTTFSQALSFSIEGEFSYDDKQISMQFQYSAESAYTYTSYRQVDLSALKDPLIIQFADTPLGKVKDTTEFDLFGDQTLEQLPIFDGDVGYLVYDKNRNGEADNGNELFGPQTGHGFNELAALDDDGNGFIDENDSAYDDLFIWQPNANRSSGNYVSLREIGIIGISTQAHETPFTFLDRQGNVKAQMRYSSIAFDKHYQARGIHQVDVAI